MANEMATLREELKTLRYENDSFKNKADRKKRDEKNAVNVSGVPCKRVPIKQLDFQDAIQLFMVQYQAAKTVSNVVLRDETFKKIYEDAQETVKKNSRATYWYGSIERMDYSVATSTVTFSINATINGFKVRYNGDFKVDSVMNKN